MRKAVQLVLVSGIDPFAKVGGHESYVLAHAMAASAAGFAPHVFCAGDHAARWQTDFATVHRVASPVRPFRGFMVGAHRPFVAAAIRRHLGDRPGPVLLHGFGVWGYVAAGVARSLARRGRRAVSVASAYTTLQHEYREKLTGLQGYHGLRQRLRHWREYGMVLLLGAPCERRGYQAQRLVLINYQSVRDRLLADYRLTVDIRQIPYAAPAAFDDAPGGRLAEPETEPQTAPGPTGVDAGPLAAPPAPAPQAAVLSDLPPDLAALASPAAPPLVVSLSRHDPRKGVDVLLHALAALRDRGIACRACLLSQGPLLAAHRALAQRLGLGDRVALPGRVDDPRPFLRHAAIFVLPSIQEGSGSLAVLEALQAGCAIVSSRCDGLPEDLTDGDNALLVPPGDVAALAGALGRLLADPALRRQLGARARATFEQRFSAAAFTAALGAAYDQLIGEESAAAPTATAPAKEPAHAPAKKPAPAPTAPPTATAPTSPPTVTATAPTAPPAVTAPAPTSPPTVTAPAPTSPPTATAPTSPPTATAPAPTAPPTATAPPPTATPAAAATAATQAAPAAGQAAPRSVR